MQEPIKVLQTRKVVLCRTLGVKNLEKLFENREEWFQLRKCEQKSGQY